MRQPLDLILSSGATRLLTAFGNANWRSAIHRFCCFFSALSPHCFVGGGRIATITVEAVSLAANGSRGPASVAAVLQLLIPLSFYIVVRILKIPF